jgi:spore coat polysaccharide biosynthesis predicted glycosyltransferase SpsG
MNQITSLSINGPSYGIGHTSRQRSLLETAKFDGWQIKEVAIVESAPLLQQLIGLWKIAKDSSCLVIDLDPRFVKKHHLELNEFIGGKYLNSIHKVVIDAGPNFPIREILNQVQFDLAIYPYGVIGATVKGDELSGFGYSIFPKELQDVRRTKLNTLNEKQNVLISCGGSDPLNITSLYLETLKHFSVTKLNIKVVIGKFFSKNQIENVKRLVGDVPHEVDVLYSPLSLEKAFEFADISFVTGGLTRNESMFSGVCTVVTDINQEQFESTKLFVERNAVVSLGIPDFQNKSRKKLFAKDVIFSILSDRKRQKELIKNAKLCFPKNGASQVLAEISVLCSR